MINLSKRKRLKLLFITFLVIIFIAVILVFNLNCNKNPVCKDCNIILISIDPFSANHLPCYGYSRNTAPNLCKIANDNIIFKNAFSNSYWTLPGNVSIFTSLYPEYHNVSEYSDVLSQKIPSLPEILQKNGYETYFYIPELYPSFPIDSTYSERITGNSSFTGSKVGYNFYNDAFDSFLSNIEKGKKTFMFLHIYELHAPYLIDENEETIYTEDHFENIPLHWEEFNIKVPFTQEIYDELLIKMTPNEENAGGMFWKDFSDEGFYDKLKNAKTLEEAEEIVKSQSNGDFWHNYSDYHRSEHYFDEIDKDDPKQIEYLKALYDQKIKETDEWWGNKLLSFLANPTIKENTIIVITADHGEEFMEHGAIQHSTIYDSNLRIPLILYIPGITNKEITAPVQSVDITPTILDAVGISTDNFFFQGQSLINLIQKNIGIDRLLIADEYENNPKAIRKGNWKLFLFEDENNNYIPYELYYTELDPNESNNILSSNMGLVNEMMEEYNSYKELWDSLLKHDLNPE